MQATPGALEKHRSHREGMNAAWNLEHSELVTTQKDPEAPGVLLEECCSLEYGEVGGNLGGAELVGAPTWCRRTRGWSEILNKSVQREETSELWCVSRSVHRDRECWRCLRLWRGCGWCRGEPQGLAVVTRISAAVTLSRESPGIANVGAAVPLLCFSLTAAAMIN